MWAFLRRLQCLIISHQWANKPSLTKYGRQARECTRCQQQEYQNATGEWVKLDASNR